MSGRLPSTKAHFHVRGNIKVITCEHPGTCTSENMSPPLPPPPSPLLPISCPFHASLTPHLCKLLKAVHGV
eukprot:748112-Hanusia_phi.AAC.8